METNKPCNHYEVNNYAIENYGSELAGDCLNCIHCGQPYEAHKPTVAPPKEKP